MLETFMNSELWYAIVSIAPSVAAVVATVVSAVLALKKVADVINEFRQSNELKELIAETKRLLEENKALKKMNEKLLVELTRIKPLGWSDSDE